MHETRKQGETPVASFCVNVYASQEQLTNADPSGSGEQDTDEIFSQIEGTLQNKLNEVLPDALSEYSDWNLRTDVSPII